MSAPHCHKVVRNCPRNFFTYTKNQQRLTIEKIIDVFRKSQVREEGFVSERHWRESISLI